jgi:23S rRNA pseudouridine2604 synthase
VSRVNEKTFRMILTQGLNRQIRRMCSALGYRVQHLRRVRIINIDLGALAPGEWRELGEAEVAALLPRRRPAPGGGPAR